MSGRSNPLDGRYDGGADDIISDTESDHGISDQHHHRPTSSGRNVLGESDHSDIASLDGRDSPDVSPVGNSRPHKVDGLGFTSKPRRSSRDLMGDENVRKESLHMTDPLQISDDELSEQDSFADANSNEIVTDDEMSISDGEIDYDDDDDHDDDFDEHGNYKYSGEDEEYEYHEMVYESDDEITVEDALATIMEGEEEEEEEEEESDDESLGDRRNGSIHQSLYRFALLNEEEEEEEEKQDGSNPTASMSLGCEEEFAGEEGVMFLNDEEGEMDLNNDDVAESINDSGYFLSKEPLYESMNDSGYFLSKEPLYESSNSGRIEDDEDNLLTLLRMENWKALNPFLHKLQMSEDEQIREDFTKMDTFGTTKMYPIHFIVWRAPNNFIKNFISSIPYKYQSETLGRLDSYGNSPLHLACSGLEVDFANDLIDVSVVEIISECGPETHEMLNKQGESPMALLMNSKALKADPENLANSEATAERLVRSMLEGRTQLIKRKNMFDFKTLLHTAASCGVHEGVSVALLELSDPSVAVMRDTSKRIPLHYVANCVHGKRPQVKIAEKLLEAQKAGAVQTTTAGETPLHVYVSNIRQRIKDEAELNNLNVAKMTEILMGSKEEEKYCSLLVKNSADLSPIHCCAMYDAPKNIMEEFPKSPFFEKAALVTDSNGAAPLHLACATQKIRATLETLKCFGTAEAAVVRDKKSRTPMHVAAENPKMTKQFIKALAEINPKAAKVRNSKGRMPLHVALRKNAKGTVIRALLKLHPKAVKTTFGNRNSIFHEMCEYKTSAPIVKSILKMHPEGCKAKNKAGNLPLHSAIVFDCSIDVVQELLDSYPEGAIAKNKNGDTPLHLAATKKSLEVVELLISVGTKAVIYVNQDGKKPLDVAKSVEGNDEVVTFMEGEIKEYLEERARQQTKNKETKEKRSSGKEGRRRNSKGKKRSSRSRSNSDDSNLHVEEEEAPKKPSSLSKIISRSSGTKAKRRASGGDVKRVDPDAKQEKRALRRMLKSFQKVTSPLGNNKNTAKKDVPTSDASTEKKADASTEKKADTSSSDKTGKARTKSDHTPKERPQRGLSRSKSATGFGKSAEESISEESTLRTKLSKSRSFKFSKSKPASFDASDDHTGSRSRRSLFSKKKNRTIDVNDGDVGKDIDTIDDSTSAKTSPKSSRKIRSGRKKDSKAPSSTQSSTASPGTSGHRSPKGSRRGKKSIRNAMLEEDPKYSPQFSLLSADSKEGSLSERSSLRSSQRSVESDIVPKRKKAHKSPKRRKNKPELPIKEDEVAPPPSESPVSKPQSQSSISKHASESLETKNTAESSRDASLSSANAPADPPECRSKGPSDPRSIADDNSLDTEDEWF